MRVVVFLLLPVPHLVCSSQVQLEHAKSKADEFDQFFQLVRDQLATCEPKKEPIHCDVHALRQQLEEHKVI